MKSTSIRHRLALVLMTFFLLCLSSLIRATPVRADGIFIPAPGRIDGVFGPDNGIVYITSDDRVLRYDLSTLSFLPPFVLGGHLRGLDLSPDGNTLAVADGSYLEDAVWIHLVHLDTGASEKVVFSRAFYEAGTFTVAYGSDGCLLITSDFAGSGWVPLRRYDPATGTLTMLGEVSQNTMLSASADRSVIAYAESNSSNGPWGRYFVATGTRGQAAEAHTFLYEIAANRNATQFAVPVSGGTLLYDAMPRRLGVLGSLESGEPIGVAYHPTQDLLYAAWGGTPEVRVFETVNFQQVDSFDVGHSFGDSGWAFVEGRLKTSHDGALLLATVEGAVRVLRTDATRTQTSLEASSNLIAAGNPVTLTATVQWLAPASGAPSGTVTFYRRESYGYLTPLRSIALDETGRSAITLTLAVGTYNLTAAFDGTLEVRSSASSPVSLQVERASTLTQMEVAPAQPVFGQTLIITTTVRRTTPGTLDPATGYVEIRDGTHYLGYGYLDSWGRTKIRVSVLDVGSHCLTATYTGDQNNNNSTSSSLCFVVDRADTVVHVEGSLRQTDDGIMAVIIGTVRAAPPGSGTPSGQAALYEGTLALGTFDLDPAGRAIVTVLGLSDAAHVLRIDYAGDARFKPSSGSVAIWPLHRLYLPYLLSRPASP